MTAREEVTARLLQGGVAGPHRSHQKEDNVLKASQLASGEPDSTFGMPDLASASGNGPARTDPGSANPPAAAPGPSPDGGLRSFPSTWRLGPQATGYNLCFVPVMSEEMRC